VVADTPVSFWKNNTYPQEIIRMIFKKKLWKRSKFVFL